jgi:hypothetical protein
MLYALPPTPWQRVAAAVDALIESAPNVAFDRAAHGDEPVAFVVVLNGAEQTLAWQIGLADGDVIPPVEAAVNHGPRGDRVLGGTLPAPGDLALTRRALGRLVRPRTGSAAGAA